MRAIRRTAVAASIAIAAAALPSAPATAYPTKPIRFVVTFAPGGGTDIIARALGQKFHEWLGQPVVVDNRAGANGNIGTDLVAKSQSDGYTILLTTNAPIAINPHLYKKLPFDPLTDVAPITMVASLPFVLVTHPSIPVKSVRELIALAKAKPASLTYGSSGTGGGAHLSGEMLKNVANIEITHVPYKGGGPALIAVRGGEVNFMFISILTVTPFLQQKVLRPIAVTSAKRSKALPDVPAMAELRELKGFETDLWYGMFAPAKTDPKILDTLARTTRKALSLQEFQERFGSTGAELLGNSPAEFARLIKADYEKWKPVVKSSGATAY
ncbi:MAG: tripartite tricarboxylate transporter substrate binding protein [Betaproteobacteria bacterium]|nr:tripartite tricarboxylate transporter substrate binding protein [Betaproteobacteria bacterium]